MGLLKTSFRVFKIKKIDFKMIVANMHLLPEKDSYKEIEKDGFHIDEKIYMNLAGSVIFHASP